MVVERLCYRALILSSRVFLFVVATHISGHCVPALEGGFLLARALTGVGG